MLPWWAWLAVAAGGLAALFLRHAYHVVSAAALAVLCAFVAVLANRTEETIDVGQWVAACAAFLTAVGAVLYAAGKSPREGTVEARSRAVRLTPWTLVFVTVGVASGVVSLIEPNLRSWFLPVVGALVLTAVAREASKRTLRLTAGAIVVASMIGIGLLGAQAQQEETAAKADAELQSVQDQRLQLDAALGEALREQLTLVCEDDDRCVDRIVPDDPRPQETTFEERVEGIERLADAENADVRERVRVLYELRIRLARLEVLDDESDGDLGPHQRRRDQASALVEVREIGVALAQLRHEDGQATASVLSDAEAALDEAQANLDALPIPPVDVQVLDLVSDGLEDVLASTPGTLVGDEIDPVLSSIGLLVLVLAVMLLYRQLEIVNNGRYGTPTEVTEIMGVSGGNVKPLTQRLQERIRAAGTSEPASVPGGTTGAELVEAFSQAEGLPHSRIVAPVIRFWQVAAFPPAGVKIRTSVVRHSTEFEASVEITTRVAERFVGSGIVTASSQVELVDKVAGFVAADALNFATGTPPWGTWQDRDGEALSCYRQVAEDLGRVTPKLTGKKRTDLLEHAYGCSPSNALVRLALAHEYDRDGKHVKALHLHLVSAIDYPTMLQSRYRVATSLLMLAGSSLDEPSKSFLGSRDAQQLFARRYGEPMPAATGELAVRRQLIKWAMRELADLDKRLRPGNLVWWAARPSERDHWIGLLKDRDERQLQRSTYQTVLLGAGLQRAVLGKPCDGEIEPPTSVSDPESVESLEAQLKQVARFTGQTSPTAHYNAACFYSRLGAHRRHTGDPSMGSDAFERSLMHLAEALRRGGPKLFKRSWLEADPDLAAVQEHPGFDGLLESLSPSDTAEDQDTVEPPPSRPGNRD